MLAPCPHCRHLNRVNSALVGRSFICTGCKVAFLVEPPPRCPHCGGELTPGSVLCVGCGFHLERQACVAEAVVEPPPPAVKPPWPIRALHQTHDLAPGLFRPLNLAMFLLCAALAVGVAILAVIFFGLGLFFETLYIGSFALLIHAQGSAFLFLPTLHTLKSAFIEIEGDAWQAYLLVLFSPVIALLILMHLLGGGGR